MPDRPHQFDGRGQAVAMVFVEPETLAGRALLARYGGADLSPLHDDTLHALATALHAAFDARAARSRHHLRQAAAIAHLLPSRFRLLFVEQTGISFRADCCGRASAWPCPREWPAILGPGPRNRLVSPTRRT